MDLMEMIGGVDNKVMHVQCSELIKEASRCINAVCCCVQEGNQWGKRNKEKEREEEG